MGFDPSMLGKRRKDSLIRRVKEYSIREKGFEDTRGDNIGRPSTKELTDAERIARLEHQISYLKQENQFLKKIEFLDIQAEWKEKQKQHLKKNSNSSEK